MVILENYDFSKESSMPNKKAEVSGPLRKRTTYSFFLTLQTCNKMLMTTRPTIYITYIIHLSLNYSIQHLICVVKFKSGVSGKKIPPKPY